jgi:hypothetical protein
MVMLIHLIFVSVVNCLQRKRLIIWFFGFFVIFLALFLKIYFGVWGVMGIGWMVEMGGFSWKQKEISFFLSFFLLVELI